MTQQITFDQWVDGFLLAKRSQQRSGATLHIYKKCLAQLSSFLAQYGVATVEAIEPNHLRSYLVHLDQIHYAPTWILAQYKSLKAFLNWYAKEAEPQEWTNPIRKVSAPKVPEKILDPANLDDVRKIIEACGHTKNDIRDKAIILTLLDTGARAGELAGFDLADLNIVTGALIIRRGKGGTTRSVFVGHKTRKALRAYLKVRGEEPGPLFQVYGRRVCYHTLHSIVRRKSIEAGVKPPALHSFRRAFALNCLRAGMDLLSLQRLLGHSNLTMLKKYVKQNDSDLQTAFAAVSPVDRSIY